MMTTRMETLTIIYSITLVVPTGYCICGNKDVITSYLYCGLTHIPAPVGSVHIHLM